MSLADWKAKFYPVCAREHADIEREQSYQGPDSWKLDAPDAVLSAVDHSLLKWSGLDHETLSQYGLRRAAVRAIGEVLDDGRIGATAMVDASTCALCVRYMDECENCPITDATGRPCSYELGGRGDKPSSYAAFIHTGNTAPMLAALRSARECVIEFFPQLKTPTPKEKEDATPQSLEDDPRQQDPDTL